MATVINDSGSDVVYQVDDGPGGGGQGERDARRQDHSNKVPDGDAVTGWLSRKSGGDHRAEDINPEGNQQITVSIYRDKKGPMGTEINLAVQYPVERTATCTWNGTALICQ